MKILFLTWKDISHPQKGGAEVVVWNYARELIKLGHEVTWVGSRYSGSSEYDTIDEISIVRYGSINTMYFSFWKYYKKHLAGKYDIIIDEAGGPPLFSLFYEKKIPIIFLIHHISDIEWDYKFPFPLSKFGKWCYQKCITLYKNTPTITVSNSTKNELIDMFGFQENNIQVIENALDLVVPKDITQYTKENIILFFGRIMPMKRVEDAISAFEIYKEQAGNGDNYQLHIVGPYNSKDSYYQKIQDKIHTSQYYKDIKICGGLPLEEREKIATAKILLVPSEKEGYGFVVIEANSYGIPALGYKVAGIQDSIHEGVNGFKFDEKDHVSMGEKLYHILQDKGVYSSLSLSSHTHAQQHPNWKQNTKVLEKYLQKIISSK